ncbi:MAG: MMPL family transporter [Deltaproteobacteria bacterium]|nr:MMPL family transporter [Deltaproteobacteria bacterium]MBW2360062.1 MMPL family transporter [Deltaproteobacteria bacterium]
MEDRLGRILAAWVDAAQHRARAILVWTGVVTVALLGYAALSLGVNMHHTAILDDDLPFWKHYHEFADVFPILDEALLVVVDADTATEARDAALLLADNLAQRPEAYKDVYVPGGDEFFERNALLYLSVEEIEDLSDHLASVQPLLASVSQDASLGNMAVLLEDGIRQAREHPEVSVDLSLIFDSLSRAAKAVLEGSSAPISWTEMILRKDLPGDSARRVVVLEPVFDYDHMLPGYRAMKDVRQTAVALGLTPENGVNVRITGNVALNTEEMMGVVYGAALAIGSSLALVALILSVALRAWHLVVSVLITLLVSLFWTTGFATAAVGHINLLSICFAVLVIGLGVDFGIHLVMRYTELMRARVSHGEALQEATRNVGGSLVLCAATTAMSFFVFIPTDYKAVGELGMIAGVGMLISLICTLTVLPALLSIWSERSVGTPWRGALWFERVVITAASNHSRAVRWCALVLALASVLALPTLRFDHNVANMRDPDTESVQVFNELVAESDTPPWTMDVLAPDLATANAAAAALRELDVVERAVTLADYVPTGQEEKLELLLELGYFVPEPPAEKPQPSKVPLANQIATLRALQVSIRAPWLADDAARGESADSAVRYLDRFLGRLERLEQKTQQEAELKAFERSLTGALPGQLQSLWIATDPSPVTLETLPESLSRRMLSPEGFARVEILPAEDLSDNAAHETFVDTVKSIVPEATGSAVTILEFGRAVVRSFRQALAMALTAVALLLFLLWRRLDDMVLVLLPLGLALLVTTASAAVIGIPFNFANIIVLPLLLGIGVDSGIHLVHRHRVTVDTLGHAEAPERALLETSTAQAVFFSALTTMASFGSLSFSDHVGFATLGQLLLLGVAFVLLANLIVLPALLARRGGPASGDGL